MVGRQPHASKSVMWLTEQERKRKNKNRKQPQSNTLAGLREAADVSSSCNDGRRKFCCISAPGLMGGLEGVGEAQGRAKIRTQVLIDNLSQALSTVPRGKQGASPYLYQLTGVTMMGKEGGRGPASSSHCSLGCCWFNECHLVFDWIPLSEVTCFLSQLWYLTMTFCLLPLALNHSKYTPGLPGGLKVKNPPAHVGTNPWVGKILWRRKWHPTPVFLPGNFHGQRSLAGYSPLGCKRVGHDSVTKQQQQQNMPSVKLTVLTVFSVGFCGIEHIHSHFV